MLKQFLFALLFCLLAPCAIAAQKEVDSAATATLVDEFPQLAVSDLIARLDNVRQGLQNDPTAKAFLINFPSRLELPGASPRFLNGMKNYLVKNGGVEPTRIILINGSSVNCKRTQLWIAPAGTAPKPKVDAYETTFYDLESIEKFDEYYFDLDFFASNNIDIETGYGFGSVDSLDFFAAAVGKTKGATAYVTVYPQSEGRYDGQTDAPNIAARMSRKIRSDLINKHKLAASKIQIVNGGRRRLRQVELWILPGGEHPPVATPNAFPKSKRKKRGT